MKLKKICLTLVFAFIFLAGAFVSSTEAQHHRRIIVHRPVFVRPYWGFHRYYYDPFWADAYKTPYERYQEERWYAQRELAGDQRELAKHREKYRRDGVITDKERRELDDDVRDVAKARERLARLNRYY